MLLNSNLMLLQQVLKISGRNDVPKPDLASYKFFPAKQFAIYREFFIQHPNPIVELFVTVGIAILVIAILLLANAIICTSPFFGHYLFGVKKM